MAASDLREGAIPDQNRAHLGEPFFLQRDRTCDFRDLRNPFERPWKGAGLIDLRQIVRGARWRVKPSSMWILRRITKDTPAPCFSRSYSAVARRQPTKGCETNCSFLVNAKTEYHILVMRHVKSWGMRADIGFGGSSICRHKNAMGSLSALRLVIDRRRLEVRRIK